MRLNNKMTPACRAAVCRQWVLALAVAAPLLALAGPATADFKVVTPDVNPSELSLESVGDVGHDSNPAKSGELSQTGELEYNPTNWWKTELEFEFNRDAGPAQTTHFSQITLENTFQFSERGEYWLDAGFFGEYGQSRLRGAPDETTFGPVLRKDFWGTSNTLDLFLEKDIGAHAQNRPNLLYAWETRVDALQIRFGRSIVMEPGLQIYGQPGSVGRFTNWSAQDNRAGPQLFGKIFNLGPGALEWNGGVLFGLTPAVPLTTVRWQLEYEIHY